MPILAAGGLKADMDISTPIAEDWEVFRQLTSEEGWRVPQRELDLFAGPLAKGAFVLRVDDEAVVFVTLVSQRRNAWIGNLIVSPLHRGKGFGRKLFAHALDWLQENRIETVWLTASEAGRPLYESYGFQDIGGIERWGKLPQSGRARRLPKESDLAPLIQADRMVWGESRLRLLTQLGTGGASFSCGGSHALLQSGDDLQIIGPWITEETCPRENRQLLTGILEAAAPGVELVTDVYDASPLRILLTAAGFERCGGTRLMRLGPGDGVDLTSLVSLASLGSFG